MPFAAAGCLYWHPVDVEPSVCLSDDVLQGHVVAGTNSTDLGEAHPIDPQHEREADLGEALDSAR
jgi:hypothetical protein